MRIFLKNKNKNGFFEILLQLFRKELLQFKYIHNIKQINEAMFPIIINIYIKNTLSKIISWQTR